MGKERVCYRCAKRYPGCHGSCPDYKREKAEDEKKKAAENAEREFSLYMSEHFDRCLTKNYRRKQSNSRYGRK